MTIQDYNDMLEARDRIHRWANETFPSRIPESSLFKLVMEEIPELLMARKEGKDITGEMADCFILLLDLCAIWGIDPARAIHAKMMTNMNRKWQLDAQTGFYNHV